MSEIATQQNVDLPLVVRWKELAPNGSSNWFLNALESDGQFWGYVHIRTDAVSENRSFVGQLDELKCAQIFELVRNLNIGDVGTGSDGLLGLGTRSKLRILIKYDRKSNQCPSFLDIISVLLPEMKLAAKSAG